MLYPHYATLQRVWGPTPLEDQQLAGGIMWAAGDLIFLVPLPLLTLAWFRSEEEKGRLHDEQLDRERARVARASRGRLSAQTGSGTRTSTTMSAKSTVR